MMFIKSLVCLSILSIHIQVIQAQETIPLGEIQHPTDVLDQVAQNQATNKQSEEKKSEQEKKGQAQVQEQKKKKEEEVQQKEKEEKAEADKKVAAQEEEKKSEQEKKEEVQEVIVMPEAPVQPIAESIMKKREEEKEQKQEEPVVPAEGIDTLEQEGGNWLLKRQALEKTVNIIEEINNYFTRILENRIDYLMKRNKVDREFDMFMNKIGFDLGDLHNTLQTMESNLKKERQEVGDLTEAERTALQELDEKIKEIQQIKENLVMIADLDASLDDAIMQVEKEISMSNLYQTEAWKNFQMIKKILSDEKAEELYLTTQGLLKNMQQIDAYLKGKLLDYFNGIISRLQQEMNDLESKFESLKERGINLEEELKKMLEKDQQKGEEPAQETQQAEKEVKEKVKKTVPQGWFSYIGNIIWSPIAALFDYIASWFVVGPQKVQTTEPTPSDVPEKR